MTMISEILKIKKEQVVESQGWVRTCRSSGKIAFIEINDGSSTMNLQIVCKPNLANFSEIGNIKIGSFISVKGNLAITNKENQPVEIQANELKILKIADEDYPLQKKEHSMEFLRANAHLRVRTKTFQAIMSVRSKMAFAIHEWFNKNHFYWVAAPLITGSDAEGAGECFEITTNDKKFFDKKASLTVSGQLNAEAYAQGLGNVYTFGPTFRAEKSHTNRHLCEFWMIEPEMANADLTTLINTIEKFIKEVIAKIKTECNKEFKILDSNGNIAKKIDQILNNSFVRLDYSQAIEDLKAAVKEGYKFEDSDIFFGKDLASEHERYLCEQKYQCPVFLMNFPIEIKAFYMKKNPDNKTVAACDLLVPGVGEIVGGSQREDDYNKLLERCKELKMDLKPIQWYLDLRKYGYYQSAGFGLGFERLIMYICDLDNIKDTIPFPRTPGGLNF